MDYINQIELICKKDVTLPGVYLESKRRVDVEFKKHEIYKGYERNNTFTFFLHPGDEQFLIVNIQDVLKYFFCFEAWSITGPGDTKFEIKRYLAPPPGVVKMDMESLKKDG